MKLNKQEILKNAFDMKHQISEHELHAKQVQFERILSTSILVVCTLINVSVLTWLILRALGKV